MAAVVYSKIYDCIYVLMVWKDLFLDAVVFFFKDFLCTVWRFYETVLQKHMI